MRDEEGIPGWAVEDLLVYRKTVEDAIGELNETNLCLGLTMDDVHCVPPNPEATYLAWRLLPDESVVIPEG